MFLAEASPRRTLAYSCGVTKTSGPDPTASFSFGMVPRTDEEERAFLQARLGLLGKWMFLFALAGLVSKGAAVAIWGAGGPFAHMTAHPNWSPHAVVALKLGALWAVCGNRRLTIPRRWLLIIDAGIALSMGMGATAASKVMTHVPAPWLIATVAFSNMVFVRTVFIPSSAKRTLCVGLIALAPVAVGNYLGLTDPRRLVEPEAVPVVLAGTLMWSLVAVGSSTVASHLIYGLRVKAREAAQLGQYTLVEKIGEGGMGAVFKAKHALLRRPTAVKLLLPEKASKHDLMRFEREVQLTSQLKHPNTVAIYDYGHTPDGIFYYAMEYLDGLTLEALVEEYGPQPPGRVIHILAQVLSALNEAHGTGLIHRDVKPANILLCERGGVFDMVKVVDFGLVKEIQPGNDAAVTLVNTIAGTPFYVSPEAIREPQDVDARSDLYAVGAVGYYLLTGKVVFDGKSIIEVCGHHLHSAPVAPSTRLGRALPEDLVGLILRCLEKERGARPRDAAELREALLQCEDAAAWGEAEARAWWEEHRGDARGDQAGGEESAEEMALAATAPQVAIDVRARTVRVG
jgi:serine/threonine-protein kinase